MAESDQQGLLRARIRELMDREGATQEQCAAALGIRQTSFSGMLNENTRIRRRDLSTLADFFGMALEEAFPMFNDPVPIRSGRSTQVRLQAAA